jgi:hypothetical protein
MFVDNDDYESPLRMYDKVGDRNLFNMLDQEQMKLAGSPILVFKYLATENLDDVYGEERSKAISLEPIKVYGHYDPRPIEENLTQFGIELTNDQQFTFNKSYIERKLGRPIVAGDVIQPQFQNYKYQVFEVQEDSFEAYGVYHLLCSAKLLRDSQDVHMLPIINQDPQSTELYLGDDDQSS